MTAPRKHRLFLWAASAIFGGLAIWSATINRWDTFLYWAIFAFLFGLQAQAAKWNFRAGYFHGRTELLRQITEGSARGLDGAEILHAVIDADMARAKNHHWP